MLPLPNKLQIERDHEEELSLLKKARVYLESRDREGIHATDLLDPRLSFFKKTTGAPIPDRLLNVFLIGQVLHAIVQVVDAGSKDYTNPPEVGTKFFEDLAYTPDIMNLSGEPNELKTTRSFYLPKSPYLPDESTYHMYLEQLLVYMAAEDKISGRLTVLMLNHKEDGKTAPQIFVWKITTTPQALEALREVIRKAKAALAKAVETKDHTPLPLCRTWKCLDCEFFQELCKPPGRFEFGQNKPKDWTA